MAVKVENGRKYFWDEQLKKWVGGSRIRAALTGVKERCFICQDVFSLHNHHIDEDISNASFDNIIVLCKRCHSNVHAGNVKLNDYLV